MSNNLRDKASKETSVVMGITDLMTSLAVIFILLLTLFINAQFASKQKSQDIRQKLIAALTNSLRETQDDQLNQVVVRKDPRDPLALTVEINIRLLGFSPDQAKLPAEGKDFLNRFIPTFAPFVCETYVNDIQSIVVEGHTDPTAPLGKDSDEYNIPLSQERARAVMQYSLDLLYGESDGHRDCLLDRSSINGRGRREPPPEVAGRSPVPQDYQAMRRVVFKIRIKSGEQRDLAQVDGVVFVSAG